MKTPSPESSRLYWVLWADEPWKAFSTQAEARHAAKFYSERGCPTYTEGEIESNEPTFSKSRQTKRPTPMKISFELELSDQEVRMLQDNSLERVHQTTTTILKYSRLSRTEVREETYEEDRYMAYHDLQDLGPLVNKLWNSARDAAFIEQSKIK